MVEAGGRKRNEVFVNMLFQQGSEKKRKKLSPSQLYSCLNIYFCILLISVEKSASIITNQLVCGAPAVSVHTARVEETQRKARLTAAVKL